MQGCYSQMLNGAQTVRKKVLIFLFCTYRVEIYAHSTLEQKLSPMISFCTDLDQLLYLY